MREKKRPEPGCFIFFSLVGVPEIKLYLKSVGCKEICSHHRTIFGQRVLFLEHGAMIFEQHEVKKNQVSQQSAVFFFYLSKLELNPKLQISAPRHYVPPWVFVPKKAGDFSSWIFCCSKFFFTTFTIKNISNSSSSYPSGFGKTFIVASSSSSFFLLKCQFKSVRNLICFLIRNIFSRRLQTILYFGGKF